MPITTKVDRSNPAHDKAYSIQHYVITFVSDLRLVWFFPPSTPVSSPNKADYHDIADILVKVALKTITLALLTHPLLTIYIWGTQWLSNTKHEILTFRKHMDSPRILFGGFRVAHHFSFFFSFSSFCVLRPMLPVSLDCPFLVTPSVFFNVYLHAYFSRCWFYFCTCINFPTCMQYIFISQSNGR